MKRFFLLLPLLWSGCNLAPKYSRPDPTLPTSFREETESGDLLANGLWWQSLGDEVLNTLIQTALENNKDLQVAIWRVSQYFAQYEMVRSSLFPQFSVSALAVKEALPIDENFLPSGLSPITPDFRILPSMSYELDFWGKLRNASFAAYSEYLSEVENRRTVVLTLISSVAQSYILLRQLDLQLELASSILSSRKEAMDIAWDRFEGGLTSKIEVDQAISVYQETLAKVEELKKKVPQQENLLSVLLGQNPGSIPRGKSLRELYLPTQIPTGMPADLLTQRPDILQAENKLIAANANIGVARAAFFPQVSFAALYGLDGLQLNSLFSNSSRTWTIGGSLFQQVFTGGKLMGQLKRTKAEKQEMLFQYEQTILVALREVNDSLIGLKQSKLVFLADQGEVLALKDYLNLAWDRYYEGQTQYLTVLDAERQVLAAELQLASAEADQFLALVDLYKSLGGGWVLESDSKLQSKKQ